jgi:hypothetical protein
MKIKKYTVWCEQYFNPEKNTSRHTIHVCFGRFGQSSPYCKSEKESKAKKKCDRVPRTKVIFLKLLVLRWKCVGWARVRAEAMLQYIP